MSWLLLVLSAFAESSAGRVVYATADAEALRWPDAAVVSLKLQKGDELELILQDGAKLRVRKGSDFGWIDAALTSPVKPEEPAAPEAPPSLPTLPG